MNKKVIELINKEHFEEYLKSLEFGYLDTIKNIYHLPNMMKDVEKELQELEDKEVRTEDEEQKIKDLKGIQTKQEKDFKDNQKNIEYFENAILYFNEIKW